MLADIMFRSNEFDEAIRYFAQMLQLTPNNYKALEQLILLVRRAGRLHVTSANRQCDAVCMCVCERERERQRERVCVCVNICIYMCVCIGAFFASGRTILGTCNHGWGVPLL
jgi:hypothetical protein